MVIFSCDHSSALIIYKGYVGEVYNIGGYSEKQNIEIVKIICKELGKPKSLISHVSERKCHDMCYTIDLTKIHGKFLDILNSGFCQKKIL